MITENTCAERAAAEHQNGLNLEARGQWNDAVACYRRALELDPELICARHDLGHVLLQQGHYVEAQREIEQVRQADPRHLNANINLGYIEQLRGNADAALGWYRLALDIDPRSVTAHNNVGNVHLARGNLEAALASYELALGIDPNDADTRNNLGSASNESRRPDEAEQQFRRALRINPNHPQALLNLGNLVAAGRASEAIALLSQATAIRPEWTEAHVSLGSALHDAGDLDRAARSYRRALALTPDHIRAHVYLGLSLLLQGEWEAGWEEYEWRWRSKAFRETLPGPPELLWHEPDSEGKDILVFAEQGMGDTLQFVRYLPLLRLRSRQVFLRCQPALKRLLSGIDGVDVVGTDEELPQFDRYVPLMSLGRIFETTPSHIPGETPYVRADSSLIEEWKVLLPGPGPRVGLVWAGNPDKAKDRFRSMPLAALEPLCGVPGIGLVSLQTGPCASELAAHGQRIPDIGSRLSDFADTAAVISQLDLVITVDTAVAHLTGAMGKPVWILLSSAADWRWLATGEATAWYPTARLFRQRRLDDWQDVVERVAAELARVVDEGCFAFPSPESQTAAANGLLERGRFDAAIAHYREALDARAAHVPAHLGLGRALWRQGKLGLAGESFDKVLRLTEGAGTAAGSLEAVEARSHLERIAAVLQRRIDQGGPPAARDETRLGHILQAIGQQDRAVECFRSALQRDGQSPWTLVSLAWELIDRGESEEAVDCLQRALAVDGDYADAHFALAHVLLSRGELEAGWREYEWRWRSHTLAPLLGVSAPALDPAWMGEELHGRSIVLHAEQGLGDTLQFVRYVPLVAKRGGRVIIGCQPELKGLLASMPDVDEVRAAGERLYSPDSPVHAAMLSLPRLFGTTLEDIPGGPYIQPDHRLAEKWAANLAPERRFKIGLVWAGGAFNPRNRDRSLPLDLLANLVDPRQAAVYSLQTGAAAQQALHTPAPLELVHLGPRLTDFAETAAALCQMDLVISVDTASAHLAGAMGRPVWILLPWNADWRWLRQREDSPWYPTARLFRQPRPGDWRSVVSRVSGLLPSVTRG